MKDEYSIQRIANKLNEIRQHQEAELHKLCQQPELLNVAAALTDALLGSLPYLFNFSSANNGNGEGTTEILEIVDRLEEDIKKTFREITGKEYLDGYNRRSLWNKERN